MKKLLRTAVTTLLLLAFVLIIWVQNNHVRLIGEFKHAVQKTLSDISGDSVMFRAVRFSPPFSISLDEIKITSRDTGYTLAEIASINISPDFRPLFTEHIIRVAFRVSGLKSVRLKADFEASADLPVKNSLRETFRADDIKKVRLSKGEILLEEYHISKLAGDIEFKDGKIRNAELAFTFRDEDLMLDFAGGKEENSFYGRFRSKDYTVRGYFLPEKDTILIESLRGNIFSMNVDLSGKIGSISRPGERSFNIKGHATGKIKDLTQLAIKHKTPWDALIYDSVFTAVFETSFSERSPENLYLSSTVDIDKISFKDIDMERISGKVSVASGCVSISDMLFFLGPHPATLKLTADIKEKDMPLEFTVSASGMSIKDAFNNVRSLHAGNYGPLDLDLSFSGSGTKLYSAVDHFIKTGTIPHDGNIFQGMKMSGHISLENYRAGKNMFEDISADFSLIEGHLEASNMFFRGFGGDLSGKGGISFFEDDIPVFMDISVTNMDPSLLSEGILASGDSAEGPIDLELSLKGPGKMISKLLRQPGEDATGENLPYIKKIWRTALLDENKSGIKQLDVDISFKMARFFLSGIKMDGINAVIGFKKGVFAVPSLFFNAAGGRFKADGDISLSDRGIPVFFEISLAGVDPSALPNDIFYHESLSIGSLDMDISFLGSGHFLSYIADNGGASDQKTVTSPVKELWRKILRPEHQAALSLAKASASARLKGLDIKGVRFENAGFTAGLDNGKINASSFFRDPETGSFQSEMEFIIDYARFPTYVNFLGEKLAFSDISRHLMGAPGMAEGSADIAFFFSGYGDVLTETYNHIISLEKTGTFTFFEKFRSAVLRLSEKRLFERQQTKSSFYLTSLRIGGMKFDNIFGEMLFNEGKFSVPSLTGMFYGGAFSLNLETDLNYLGFPFTFKTDVKKAGLAPLVRDTVDKKSPVHGNFDLNLRADGKLEYQSSYSGSGSLEIYDANLGRVPILTPLLGWIYEGLENIFPAFKKINIDSALATFEIKNRQLVTNDLILSGSDICLVAEGSLGFDGSLDFTFENELLEQKPEDEPDWPVSVRNFITSFGKTISRARLKGTIKDQKWEFEYLAPVKKAIHSHFKAFFEGISR
jgi:hypothetical protein